MPQQLRTPLGRLYPWPLTRAGVIEGQQCYPGMRLEAVLALGCTIEDVPEPPPPTLEFVRAEALRTVRAAAQAHILATYPEWLQRNAALGLEATELTERLAADITAVRQQSDVYEDSIGDGDAALIAQVLALLALPGAWPAIGG